MGKYQRSKRRKEIFISVVLVLSAPAIGVFLAACFNAL